MKWIRQLIKMKVDRVTYQSSGEYWCRILLLMVGQEPVRNNWLLAFKRWMYHQVYAPSLILNRMSRTIPVEGLDPRD